MSAFGQLHNQFACSKNEESGAGESLADVPKDLPDEMVEATIEAVKPESPEESKTLPPPPPPVEAPAAE
ncbi:hypothetical protein RUM44_012087 [Polyplax serrata]|uniref:Uncharacterized protein n=1 Tax=Polyplax serrata TaxID=468196 RepID=A0ABR1BE74_POLSC